MIISHKHKFIFLKTNKTAGTSIEIALSKYCGEKDIVTPISPEDEELRSSLGFTGPRNYLAPRSDYDFKDVAKLLLKGRRKHQFYNHISASDARAKIEDGIWNSYFKFCFERKRWDRVVSLYYHLHQTDSRPTISEFIDSETPMILKRRGFDLYTLGGTVAVDRVCKYEALGEELSFIQTRLGIHERIELPNAKSNFRKDKRGYRELLGDSEKIRLQ